MSDGGVHSHNTSICFIKISKDNNFNRVFISCFRWEGCPQIVQDYIEELVSKAPK